MNGGKVRIGFVSLLATVMAAGACGSGGGDEPAAAADISAQQGVSDPGAPLGSTSDPASIKTDFGADASKIRIGLLADLSGPFSVIVKDVVTAQQVFWDGVNDRGGIGGRQVELVIEDTKYDMSTHKARFQAMKSTDGQGVLIISQSTGSPQTAAIRDDLEATGMIAIPLSFYSGMADPAFGRNIFETYTNFCFESINSLQYLKDEEAVKTVAIVSFPGEYGQDGAKGAKIAAEKLGLKVVYDGEAKVIPPSGTNPNPDNSAVVQSIVDTDPDLVWASVNPSTMAVLLGQTSAKGYEGKWSGNAPSYHENLLKSDVKEIVDARYFYPSYTASAGTDVPAMDDMRAAIQSARPDTRLTDFLVIGWTEAMVTESILRQAAAAGDLTRTGVERAAFAMDKVDFGGLAPAQAWKGAPDDYIVRESYMYKPKVSLYREGAIGKGHNGNELLKGPFASPVTKAYSYAENGPCFKAAS